MGWSPLQFTLVIGLIVMPFLTPCARPAQPTPADRTAINKLAEELRRSHALTDRMADRKWLVASAGAEASGRNYEHIPILQIGGVLDTADQDRILAEIQQWKDHSRFNAVMVYFYGEPLRPEDPYSALHNMKRSQRVQLDGAPATKK